MRILFITDNFPPEVNAPAARTYDHCKRWVEQGAEVTVITCAPNFPQGKVYEGYKNGYYYLNMVLICLSAFFSSWLEASSMDMMPFGCVLAASTRS